MENTDHYVYRVTWSAEDEAFIGQVAEFPSLSWIADSPQDAFDGIRKLVAETIDEMVANNENPPGALVDRVYSGKFMTRITPELHRQLAIDAAEQNVSLNRLVASRLASHD